MRFQEEEVGRNRPLRIEGQGELKSIQHVPRIQPTPSCSLPQFTSLPRAPLSELLQEPSNPSHPKSVPHTTHPKPTVRVTFAEQFPQVAFQSRMAVTPHCCWAEVAEGLLQNWRGFYHVPDEFLGTVHRHNVQKNK